jgi:hypothetical protein
LLMTARRRDFFVRFDSCFRGRDVSATSTTFSIFPQLSFFNMPSTINQKCRRCVSLNRNQLKSSRRNGLELHATLCTDERGFQILCSASAGLAIQPMILTVAHQTVSFV